MKEHCPDVQKIITEIRGNIDKLRLLGLHETDIKLLLFPNDGNCKLSWLLITKEYKLFLTDFQIEIKLFPLAKAVYLVYLKYPDGISFKTLGDHKHELLEVYKCISNRLSIDDMERSISAITDPTRNTINEVCSIIKTSFSQYMESSLAQHYIISGKRGNKKRIILDRNLIDCDIDI